MVRSYFSKQEPNKQRQGQGKPLKGLSPDSLFVLLLVSTILSLPILCCGLTIEGLENKNQLEPNPRISRTLTSRNGEAERGQAARLRSAAGKRQAGQPGSQVSSQAARYPARQAGSRAGRQPGRQPGSSGAPTSKGERPSECPGCAPPLSWPHRARASGQPVSKDQLACCILPPPLRLIGGCFWLFCRLGREITTSQNWLKGSNTSTAISDVHLRPIWCIKKYQRRKTKHTNKKKMCGLSCCHTSAL